MEHNKNMSESAASLPAWKRSLIGDGMASPKEQRCALGHARIDHALGGGLALARLHELVAPDAQDAASAAGFAVMLALRLTAGARPLLWLREDAAGRVRGAGRGSGVGIYAPGLHAIGLNPAQLVVGMLPDAQAVLRATVDALRCPAVGVVVIELWGDPAVLDLTASRRLALAAEAGGVTPLLLRIAARAVPSAASTRWSVAAAPSLPLDANAPGMPVFDLELLRQRRGPGGLRWQVEWDRDAGIFREPAPSGSGVPLSRRRSLAVATGAHGSGTGNGLDALRLAG